MWLCFIYIIDGHIKSEDELRDQLKLHVIATIDDRKETSNIIDKMLLKTEKSHCVKSNNGEYIKSVLGVLLDDTGDDARVLLCSEDEKTLCRSIADTDERLIACGFIGSDPDAVDNIKYADGVILLIKLWKTTRKDVIRELEVAQSLDKRIIGAIAVK